MKSYPVFLFAESKYDIPAFSLINYIFEIINASK